LTEKPELLAKTQSWWEEILNWFKSLIIKSGFDKVAMDILSGRDIGNADDIREQGIYAQQGEVSKQDEIIQNIKLVGSKITVLPNSEGYEINGKSIRRVSDIVHDWYQRRFDNHELLDTEFDTAVKDLMAEHGTGGHADFEHVGKLVTNEDGILKTPDEIQELIDNDDWISKLDASDQDAYYILRDNLIERLQSFPEGTKFLFEQVIYDAKRNTGGTVDVMAITKEGRVNILDWKFMNLNIDNYTDIPWYKVGAWNLQMNQYKDIISTVYNVESDDFDQTRMIILM